MVNIFDYLAGGRLARIIRLPALFLFSPPSVPMENPPPGTGAPPMDMLVCPLVLKLKEGVAGGAMEADGAGPPKENAGAEFCRNGITALCCWACPKEKLPIEDVFIGAIGAPKGAGGCDETLLPAKTNG